MLFRCFSRFSAVTQTPIITAALPSLLQGVGQQNAAVAAVTQAAIRQNLGSPVKRQRTDSSGNNFTGSRTKKQNGVKSPIGKPSNTVQVQPMPGMYLRERCRRLSGHGRIARSSNHRKLDALMIGLRLCLADADILICGNCREVFPSLQKLVEHKRQRCRLRFTCRCQPSIITGKLSEVAPRKQSGVAECVRATQALFPSRL